MAEKCCDGVDRREEVPDRREGAHSAIYQVCGVCEKCEQVFPGTCFMVGKNKDAGLNDASSHYFYFVTAAHVIFCEKPEHGFCYIQVARKWELADTFPTESFLPTKNSWIGESNKFGWLAIPDKFKANCAKGKTERDRYPYDYGLIALKKDRANDKYRSELENYYGMLRPNDTRKKHLELVFLSGFPGVVRDKRVRGKMYWVPDGASKKGSLVASQEDVTSRRKSERGTAAVFSMPQHHFSTDDHFDGGTNERDVVQSLFRHYIDTSQGQSGAPLYIQDGNSCTAVAIHVGIWEFPGQEDNLACNVAVRLQSIMSDLERWAQDKKADDEKKGEFTGTERYTESDGQKARLFRPGVEVGSVGTKGGPTVTSVDLPNWDDPLGHYVLEKLGDLIATKLDGPQKQCFAQEAVMKYQNEDKNRYAEILKTFMKERDNLEATAKLSNCAGVIIWMEQKAENVTIGDLYKLLEKTTKHPKKELTEVLRKAQK